MTARRAPAIHLRRASQWHTYAPLRSPHTTRVRAVGGGGGVSHGSLGWGRAPGRGGWPWSSGPGGGGRGGGPRGAGGCFRGGRSSLWGGGTRGGGRGGRPPRPASAISRVTGPM